jgi:pilus assembly protein CpaE
MRKELTVLIASDGQSMATKIKSELARQGIECPHGNVVSLELASRVAVESATNLIFVVLSPDGARGAAALTQVRAVSRAKIVAVGAAPAPKDILDAIRAGADDYLDLSGEFEAELELLLERVRSAQCPPFPAGPVITITSAVGGSGASTLAVNLAAALAQRKTRCGVVDLKRPSGDLAMLLDLKPRHSIVDLCQIATGLDQVSLEQSLLRHGSGIELLASTEVPDSENSLADEAVVKVIQMARERFSRVIVDLGYALDERAIHVAAMSDLVVIVLRLDVVALLRTKQCAEKLVAEGIDEHRILTVANRRGQPGELSLKLGESTLGRKIVGQVPDDAKAVISAANVGNPVVLESPSAKASKAIQELCNLVESAVSPPAAEEFVPSRPAGVVNRIAQMLSDRPRRAVDAEGLSHA